MRETRRGREAGRVCVIRRKVQYCVRGRGGKDKETDEVIGKGIIREESA